MYPTFKFGKEITVLETFAGIGSQRKALDRLAKKYDLKINYLPPIEFDKYAIASYNAIHGTNHKPKDITKTKGSEYGKIDLLTYSFPCQDISIAGKQAGFSKGSGTRSGLLWEVERILKEMKYLPQVLLMENVRNLVSETHMADFQEWINELERLGYSNYWEILNAKDYGIPQNRERVFMVSILGKYNYTFPQPEPLKLRLKDMLEKEVDEKYYLSDKLLKCFTDMTDRNGFVRGEKIEPINLDEQEYMHAITTNLDNRPTDNFIKKTICINSKVNGKQPSLQDRIYDSNGISTAITTSFMPSIVISEVTKKGYVEATERDYAGVIVGSTQKNAAKNYDGICPTLTNAMGQGGGHVPMYKFNSRVRKLTPLECFRLMGFDDEDYYKAAKVNSNTQLYKQCGNSIVVNVLEKIFEMMI